MSQQQCAVTDCKRASRTVCQCCNQNLCRDHFNQHDDLLNSQLNPLTDKFNLLSERLSAIQIDRITRDSRKKLDRWRLECHRTIDRFYEQKCAELEHFTRENIDEQRQKTTEVRSKVTELIEKQETTKNDIESLTSTIRSLEQKMNDIENLHVHVDIRPLEIDNNCIKIGTRKEKQVVLDLTHLPTPHHAIDRSGFSCHELASNDRVLLTPANPYLHLYDKNLQLIWSKEYEHSIYDMCWSLTLGQFIFVTEYDVFLFNENDKLIKQVQEVKKDCWLACGCSTKSLFLSRNVWDSSISEFGLLPSVQFIKQWRVDNGLYESRRIDAINCSSEVIVLSINNESTKEKLVQIRSLDTFSILRSVTLPVPFNKSSVRCCQLNDNEWLFADWQTSLLFHINKEGKLLGTNTYPTAPYNMTIFGSRTLVVLTQSNINFHKLK